MIAQQILNGLVLGGVYALFALGFTLIFGIHRMYFEQIFRVPCASVAVPRVLLVVLLHEPQRRENQHLPDAAQGEQRG